MNLLVWRLLQVIPLGVAGWFSRCSRTVQKPKKKKKAFWVFTVGFGTLRLLCSPGSRHLRHRTPFTTRRAYCSRARRLSGASRRYGGAGVFEVGVGLSPSSAPQQPHAASVCALSAPLTRLILAHALCGSRQAPQPNLIPWGS